MSTTTAPTKAKIKAAEIEAHQLDAKRTREAQAKLQEKAAKRGGRSKQRLSFHDAAIQVLRDSDGPMSSRDIATAVLNRNLSHSKGKTPAATMATILLRGEHKKVFVKTAPGTYDLRELNPRAAKKRPTGNSAR